MDFQLIRDLTRAQMTIRYRGTVAGFFWVILNPILMYTVQAFIFKYFLKVSVPHYPLFLLSGLLPWIFLTSSLDTGIPVLQNSKELLCNFKLSPEILICASVLDNGINFFSAFVLVLIPMFFFVDIQGLGLLLLPFALFQFVIGTASLVWLLSVMNVFYRDIRFVTQFGCNILYFMTPIFYPIEMIPAQYRWFAHLNPIYRMIAPVRDCLIQFSFEKFIIDWLAGLTTSLLLLSLSTIQWKKRKNEFFYYL
ncbi:MAG: ABC transporter permease [Bdellovibrionota bacterium]